MTNTRISEVLKGKGTEVLTVGPDEPILAAARKMNERKVGSLIVLSGTRIAGIVTERDCLRFLAAQDSPPKDAKVSQIMTRQLVAVKAEDTITQAMAVMTEKRCRHLPVVQGDKLVGIVSIGDLVKQAANDQRAEIHYLTEYILGTYPAVEARGSGLFPSVTAPPT